VAGAHVQAGDAGDGRGGQEPAGGFFYF